MAENFGSRLSERLRELGPLCVGIDPSVEVLSRWGRADSLDDLEFCALSVLEATSGVVAALKPQVAFFERFGSGGFRVLERLIAEARDADILIIADAKRGDFSNTNLGYADAWLGEGSALCVDALTVSPYLGVGALAPIFDRALLGGRGVFVLAATSNPEGRSVQLARTPDDERVEDMVLREVSSYNRRDEGPGSIGVVLGATRDAPRFDLSELQGPFLVPGVGAQGANESDVARLFARCDSPSVLVSVSRDVLFAGPERRPLRDAAQRWRDALWNALA
ncbi:MAG TPA: orotidine-5'-phosphate decarboxylase [Acidimicrobiales bacterium]|jgi:orotidine-5'-phosphate decarboxylase